MSGLGSRWSALSGGRERPDGTVIRTSSQMQGNEPLWGVGLAVLLAVIAVLDLTVTTGKGAPAHPSALDPVIGLLVAVALVPVSLKVRNRLAAPLVGIVGAFFVTLAKAPSVLTYPHLLGLIGALAFALILSMRQRRVQRALMPSATDRRAAADARRRQRKGEPDPAQSLKRPPKSKRYTPPRAAAPPKGGKR